MAGVTVVGDRIEFDGEPIARISTQVAATVRGRFEEALANAHEDDAKSEDCEEVLAELIKDMDNISEAGMVEVQHIQKWIDARNTAK